MPRAISPIPRLLRSTAPPTARTRCTSRRSTRPGNSSTADSTFTLDTRGPSINVTAPAPGSTVTASPTISGSVSDAVSGTATLQEQLDGGSPVSVPFDASGTLLLRGGAGERRNRRRPAHRPSAGDRPRRQRRHARRQFHPEHSRPGPDHHHPVARLRTGDQCRSGDRRNPRVSPVPRPPRSRRRSTAEHR